MLTDTHCHLDFPEFDSDRTEVIQRARKEGVGYIINIGSSLRSSNAGVVLAEENDFIYASVGIHPHDADKTDKQAIQAVKQLSESSKVVAIGEIGLDYFRKISSSKNQKLLFMELAGFAKQESFPVIIHCRDAQDDTLRILREKNVTSGVVHCFSGDELFLNNCLDLGFFVSFTCNLTYKKAEDLRRLAGLVPLSRLLLETDAPFLPPEGFRGRRNEPGYVKFLAEKIAQIKNVGLEEIARATTENARRLFCLE